MSKLRTDFHKIHHPGKLCNCCQNVAVVRVVIQVNWFRGDDEVYLLCGAHAELALTDLAAIAREAAAEKLRRQSGVKSGAKQKLEPPAK